MTPEQTQIIEMLCEGVTPKQIMYQLNLTRDRITTQIRHARLALGCKTTCQLIAMVAVAKEQLKSAN